MRAAKELRILILLTGTLVWLGGTAIAKGEPAGPQIWVRWMDAEGAASQISHLTEPPSNLEWAPDGEF